jgi:hypothetical protein
MTGGVYPSAIYPTPVYPRGIYSNWVVGSSDYNIVNLDYPLVGRLNKKINTCVLPIKSKTATIQKKTVSATLSTHSYLANIPSRNLTAVLDQRRI